MVGATGFEPATPCTPCKCATRLRHAPTEIRSLTIKRPQPIPGNEPLAAQQLEDVFELGADLTDDLLALARIATGFVAHEPLPGATDREAFLVEKAANLADDQDVLALIITAVAAPFDGL